MNTSPETRALAANARRCRLFVFWSLNLSAAIFFDVFWLLGYRVDALDKLSEQIGYFQFVVWFACFFFASLLSLKTIFRERLVRKCFGIAVGFLVFTYLLLTFSTMLFGPYLDPWY
jgi:hypothetical protein